MRSAASRETARAGAFTLVEVLAAVFLTAVVMTIAISFFVELSDATDSAASRARQGRNALAVLDRIARDLEGAYLVRKPVERDPLEHRWAFVAEGQAGGEGADRLQFVTRNHRPRNLLDHGSDLAFVTWMLEPVSDGRGYELLRAVNPGLPEPPANEFPSADDELFMVVAEDVEYFSMRFLTPDAEWVESWDSTQLELSSLLPEAAELEIAFLPEEGQDEDDFEELGTLADGLDSELYSRRVLIPMKAVDVENMIRTAQRNAKQNAQDDGDGDADGDDPDDPDAQGSEGDGGQGQDFEALQDEVEQLLRDSGQSLPDGR